MNKNASVNTNASVNKNTSVNTNASVNKYHYTHIVVPRALFCSLSLSLSLAPQQRIGENPGNETFLPLLISTKIDSLIGLNKPGSKVELHSRRTYF